MIDKDVTQWRATRAEISLSAIRRNIDRLSNATPIWAVVKADGYGHGAVEVAKGIAGKVKGVAVSLVEEAVLLRENGVSDEILVMGMLPPEGAGAVVAYDLTVMVTQVSDLQLLNDAARHAGKKITVHLKVDTGMSRLGIAFSEVQSILMEDYPCLSLGGIASHLANADLDADGDTDSLTQKQIERFAQVTTLFPRIPRHLANTAGTLRFKSVLFDSARCGLGIYGLGDSSLEPAMKLSTTIGQVRRVSKGAKVSYGGLWEAPRDSEIAVLPVGYADGYPRAMTGAGRVLIRDRFVPVVGAVCMDMILCDVTGMEARPGDGVVLLGRDVKNEVRASEWAEITGLSEYEVVCGVSKRVPRVYK